MAVGEVFSAAELERLRRFPEPTRLELVRYFTLTGDQVEFLAGRRGDQNRLGLAVQMATLPWLGFVPDDVEAAPVEAVARLAGSLGIDPGVLAGYGPALGGTRLEWLCRGPTVASARTIHGEIAKLSYLRSIGADRVEMSVLPLERLRFLAGVGRRASPAGLRRREPTRRLPDRVRDGHAGGRRSARRARRVVRPDAVGA